MCGPQVDEQKQARAIRQFIRRVLDNLEQSKEEVRHAFARHLDKHPGKALGRSHGGRNARVRAGIAGSSVYDPPDGG